MNFANDRIVAAQSQGSFNGPKIAASRTGVPSGRNQTSSDSFAPRFLALRTSMPGKNVLGGPLQTCGTDPMTGFFRDGCCNTGSEDVGLHTVCVEVTAEFLQFSRERGNDLLTPNPMYGFPGLVPGDRWCLCASRWNEAFKAGMAPPVHLEATHMSMLEYATLDELKSNAIGKAE